MADFKTHIAVSSLLGVGYGAAGYLAYDLPVSTCVLAGGFCGLSGMLPDIDSDSGVPLRESMCFAAAIVPTMLIDRMQHLGMSAEAIVLSTMAIYAGVRFGLGAIIRRITVHRGMFHSLPAAIIFGEIAFLLSFGPNTYIRLYKAGGVVAGYLSHLVLDELYSFQWRRGRLRLKESFGTALKLVGDTWWANLSIYAKLALFTFLAFREPTWMNEFYRQQQGPPVRQEILQRDRPKKNDAASRPVETSRASQLLEEAKDFFR